MSTSGTAPQATSSTAPKKPPWWRRIAFWLAIAVCLAGFAVLFVYGPQWIDGIRAGQLGKDDGPKATVVAGFRTALAAVLVGVVGLLTLYFTAATYRQNRAKDQAQFELAQKQFLHAEGVQAANEARAQEQFNLAQEQFQHTQTVQAASETRAQEQYELSQESQITDRYVKAVGLLSETGIDAQTTRLAGVYALERIMRDSTKDHATIVQLLAAFVRRSSPAFVLEGESKGLPTVAPIPDDAAAALMVIGNRPERPEDFQIDLTSTFLGHLRLNDTNFEHADFSRSDLSNSVMEGANFRRARFTGAKLDHVSANGVDLTSAHLESARLCYSDLTSAKLGYAYLRDADLAGAILKDADLTGAYLIDAALMKEDGTGLTLVSVEQLLTTQITSWSRMPDALKENPELKPHLAKCEEDYLKGSPRTS